MREMGSPRSPRQMGASRSASSPQSMPRPPPLPQSPPKETRLVALPPPRSPGAVRITNASPQAFKTKLKPSPRASPLRTSHPESAIGSVVADIAASHSTSNGISNGKAMNLTSTADAPTPTLSLLPRITVPTVDEMKSEGKTNGGKEDEEKDQGTGEEEGGDAAQRQSPLKAASELIRSLDTAYTQVSSVAINTARNAEDARRNAKAASEIARRYSSGRSISSTTSRKHLPSPMNGGASIASATISIGGVSLTSPLRSPANSEQLLSTKSRGSYAPWDDINTVDDAGGPPAFATTPEDSKTATTPANGNDPKHGGPHFSESTPLSMSSAMSNGGGSRWRRQHKPPSSVGRLAQSHADEVLALSIELERSKQALQTEQQLHDDSKAALAASRTKNKHLEGQIRKMLEEQESRRDEVGHKSEQLEQELSRAQYRVQAAEEDAQLALDLAKQNAQTREQTEGRLEDAMKEIHRLRQLNEAHMQNHPMSAASQLVASDPNSGKHVRFADEARPAKSNLKQPQQSSLKQAVQGEMEKAQQTKSTIDMQSTQQDEAAGFDSPARSRAPRSMISAGRHLLRRARADATKTDICTTVEFTPTKSAERRRRLKQRLEHLTSNESPLMRIANNIPPSPGMGQSTALVSSSPARGGVFSDEVRNAAKLLQDSGKRLQLAGHWWRSKSAIQDIRLEAMTRQYCQSVEFKMDQHKKQIDELDALCGYLERSMDVTIATKKDGDAQPTESEEKEIAESLV